MPKPIRFGEPIDPALICRELPERVISNKGNIAKEGKFQVYFVSGILDQVWKHAKHQLRVECSGILVGRPCQTPDTKVTFVIVVGAVPHKTSRQSVGHVTIGPNEIAEAREVIEREFPDFVPVGWYHSHPGHGIFLSGQDMTIVRSIYNLAWHIALVVDPMRNQAGLFYGGSGKPLESWLEIADATWIKSEDSPQTTYQAPILDANVHDTVKASNLGPKDVAQVESQLSPGTTSDPKFHLVLAEKFVRDESYEKAFTILKFIIQNQREQISASDNLQRLSLLIFQVISGLAKLDWQKAQNYLDSTRSLLGELLYIAECEKVIEEKKNSAILAEHRNALPEAPVPSTHIRPRPTTSLHTRNES